MYALLYAATVALFLFIALYVWWYGSIPSNLPPGPPGLPILGSSLSTWDANTLDKKLLEWGKKYGPVYRVYIGNTLCVVLADYDTMHEALVKQGDTYAGRPVFHSIFARGIAGLGLVNSEGELWRIHRRFALSTLRDFGFGRPILEPRIKDEAAYLVEAIAKTNGEVFDPAIFLTNATANIISAMVFGRRFDYEDRDFVALLKTMRARTTGTRISFMSPVVLSEAVAKFVGALPIMRHLKRSNEDMIAFLKKQIEEVLLNNNNPFDDHEPTNYIEAYRKVQQDSTKDNPTFTNEQLFASVGNLFMAGTDTTASTLRWSVFLMAHHPEIQERVYEEIKRETGGQSFLNYADRKKLPFTEATIMEVQRMADLIPAGVMRRTTAPSKLRGYDIPEGTVIVPLMAAALDDPEVYPDPHVFDPNRYLSKEEGVKADTHTHLIPFMAGKRSCLGEALARMNLFIYFTAMISKFRFSFPLNVPKPPIEGIVSIFRTPVSCQVVAERRHE